MKIFVKTISIGTVLVAALILTGCNPNEEQASQEEQSVEETTEETAEETPTEDTTLAEATVEEETVVTAQAPPQATEAPQ